MDHEFTKKRTDLTRERLERTRDRMNMAVIDSVITGYEGIIETLHLPDPGDRHVLAAAIQGQAQVIVTTNLKDFPRTALSAYNIEKCSPDAFIAELLRNRPLEVVAALKEQRARLINPPHTVAQFLDTLSHTHLQRTAEHLRRYAELL
jgi:hypothetical protein